ncbi:hypothetical protein Tco_0477087, partial [Tanacetum coccineum]
MSSLRSTGDGMNNDAGSGSDGIMMWVQVVVNIVMMVELVVVVMDVVNDEWMVMMLSIYP